MTERETMLCEAATCAWEHVLGQLESNQHWKNYVEGVGYNQLRMEIIGLAPLIDEDFKRVQDNYTYCFDWDYVEDWISANVIIDDDGMRLRPDRENPVK